MKVLALLIFCCQLLAPAAVTGADFNYTRYAKLLENRVREGTVINGISATAVDYRGLAKDAGLPASDYRMLLKDLAAFEPATLKSREERIAFWVNVYNIAAMKTIVDHYPVDSIRSLRIHWRGSPWGSKVITVGGRDYSLDEIEHTILLDGFGELRIHFGINCASVSCADLLDVPYRAATLYRQLEDQGRKMLANREKGMRIDRESKTVYLSRIFSFDEKRFKAYPGGVLAFIKPYVSDVDQEYLSRGKPNIEYLDYDWTANDLKNVRQGK